MARLIHIGDLHLGRQLHGVRLLDDQRIALDGLTALIEARKPDALLIAGDVYDRAIPPADAVAVLDDFLCKVAGQLAVPVIMIAGNHDSAERLGFGSRLLGEGRLAITGRLDPEVTPVVIEDAHGPLEIFPIPFLEPARVREMAGDDSILDQQSAMEEMVRRARDRRTSDRAVLMAHAFVQGATISDSERTLSVGGAATIAPSVFEGFDYVALGHLHRPQSVGGGGIDRERVQYAGSLLKYSKSEIDHDKSVTAIEIDAAGDITTERIALPLARDFRAIEGALDQLISGEPQGNADDYVYVTLSDKGPVYDAMARLRAVYPNAIHIEQKQFVPEGAMNLPDEQGRSKSVIELFESFFDEVQGEALSDDERAMLVEVLEAARIEEANG